MRIILYIFSFLSLTAAAQKTPAKPATSKPVTNKPTPPKTTPSKIIKLKTFLGKNENGAVVSLDEGLQLINFPLRVVDNNNERCTVLSYNFMYKRKAFLENEETGKKEIKYSSVGEEFKVTPLPQLWRDNLTESLKKDEELYFFDIIIKDNLGRKMFAPELKIKIQ